MNALAITPTLFCKEICFSIYVSTGILVAKKKLFKNPVPSGCGGGSVFFVCTLHNILQKFGIKLMVTGAGLVSDHPGNSKKWSSLELVAFKNGPS